MQQSSAWPADLDSRIDDAEEAEFQEWKASRHKEQRAWYNQGWIWLLTVLLSVSILSGLLAGLGIAVRRTAEATQQQTEALREQTRVLKEQGNYATPRLTIPGQ